MGTLFALVLTVSMANGDFQDVILGVYETQKKCDEAAVEQHVSGECFPVEAIVHADEVPASALTNK